MAKILVVEDDKNTNDVISDFLVDTGYEVVSVHDGEQALRQFPENVIDLVILDIMLPKVDGLTVLKNIRVSSQVPVLMLTAMEDEHTQVISFDRMADDYITKPFSHVLKGVSAEFEAGKVYTIVGKSGSGKSTLLSLIAGLDICTGGEILHGETDLKNLDRDEYRAKGIGSVFVSMR